MRKTHLVTSDVILSQFKDRAGYIQFVREYKLADREKVQRFLFGSARAGDRHLTMST